MKFFPTLSIFIILFFVVGAKHLRGQTINLKGVVLNEKNKPIKDVNIFLNGKAQSATDQTGHFDIPVARNQTVLLSFSHINQNTLEKQIKIRKNNIFLTIRMDKKTDNLNEVVIKNRDRDAEGTLAFKQEKFKRIPGATSSIENLLMTLPGVSNNNELSTQYNVRGGNFDENLVYVNGIEVYRPFLVRSGQQEGLSFINPSMTQNILFSAGGFQAKYGDKMSSVLDITYRKPTEDKTQIEVNAMGGSLTSEGISENKKLFHLTSIRYRDNSLLLNERQTVSTFRPLFADIQSYIQYKLNSKWAASFLGHFSLNQYQNKPLSRISNFGTLSQPIELAILYQGQEKDEFLTLFGAAELKYKTEKSQYRLNLSGYNAQEEEYYDIIAAYQIKEINRDTEDPNFGETRYVKGIAEQINHARNDIDQLVNKIQLRGKHRLNTKKDVSWGLSYINERTKDRMNEWMFIDSSGFSLRPPHHNITNNEPETPYTAPIEPFEKIQSQNNLTINRITAFAQWNEKKIINENKWWFHLGLRTHWWKLSGPSSKFKQWQNVISPRFQLALKPNSTKDLLYRLNFGWYHQPPNFKELRGFNGQINSQLRAQESFHVVLANEYSFQLWDRPFKLTSELYYKNQNHINTYTLDNIRIRYIANNDATAYATGFDLRLNGEFVMGNESWISLGFLKTEENHNGRGFIGRPTDQRFKLGVLFQDYVPSFPDFKVYLNMVFNSSLPGGAPSYSDPYNYPFRLPAYKRADVGFAYVVTDASKRYQRGWLKKVKEMSLGLELFNVFDIQNSNTNTWVRDVYSRNMYGVPNYMTGRVINAKINISF